MAAKTHQHLDVAAGISPSHIKRRMGQVSSFNAKFAVLVTNVVGSMWCAYVFTLLALLSLPAILSQFSIFAGVFPAWLIKASIVALIAWIAQTFLQLVLLSVIMVGQQVQSMAADARSQETDDNTKQLIDLLNLETKGGLADLRDYIDGRLPAKRATKASDASGAGSAPPAPTTGGSPAAPPSRKSRRRGPAGERGTLPPSPTGP